jgi:methionyl-tRNA formyltransferase
MVDVYLGSDLGLWVLDQISKNEINQVFTLDSEIAQKAEAMNFSVSIADPNLINWNNSQYGVSIHYPKILKPHVISKYKKIYNLHPSFLPWGRGYYPVFWALWENTPAGASLHEINDGIDQGNIISQIQVNYTESDTGSSLFSRVREAEKQIFSKYWLKIIEEEELPSFPQDKTGTYHKKKEFIDLKNNANWKTMLGKDLIKLVRCLTFEGYSNLELLLGQKKFEISLRLVSNQNQLF